jgi:putative methylase
MMKLRKLEIALERLAKPVDPDPRLEQYTTPADVAADMLWTALSFGDIQGKSVADLGCGNGVLGIAASMLGASSVRCYDSDPKMVLLAQSNAELLKEKIEVVQASVASVAGVFDTIVQNPPFGSQNPGADRPFLSTAIRISDVAYSLHMAETTDFVLKFCSSLGAEVQHIKNYKFKIPFMFEFHKKPAEFVDVSLLRILSNR